MGEGWEISPPGDRAGDTDFRGKAVSGSRVPVEIFSLLEKEARKAREGR